MNSSMRRLALLAAVSLVGLLTLGAATASAHGGPGGCGAGAKGVSATALVTQAAKQLNITRAKLKGAIVDAAVAQIDQEVEDGDVDAGDAADLKDQAADDLRFAMAVSQTKTVAANLGITTTALNTGFRTARKALAVAKIDKALANGDITADRAAELKANLDNADLPGYKAYGGYGYSGDSGDHQAGFRR
jgi:hypothetical protein